MKTESSISFGGVVPILRIFDVPKALQFYRDYLGCQVDWEHRFEPKLPLYIQVSRGKLVLHLSEHHGDGSPGVHLRIATQNVAALHAELRAREYDYLRPGLTKAPWGERLLTLIDPFGNHLVFCEPISQAGSA